MKTKVYKIKFDGYRFPYYLGQNCLREFTNKILDLKADRYVILCDRKIAKIFAPKIQALISKRGVCHIVNFKTGEDNKNMQQLNVILEKVLGYGITRSSVIIGFGGGVSGNISGLCAGLLFRGIRFVQIPTNLTAMLDSVLSLKQSVNSRVGKNLIGIFHPPTAVFADINYLNSLSKTDIKSGLCEFVKNILTIAPEHLKKASAVLNPECFYSDSDYQYFIDVSINAKVQVMKTDPFEKGSGLILEYGHTIGHTLELNSKAKLTHGESIGLGMLCAAEIAYRAGYLKKADRQVHLRLLQKIGCSLKIPKDYSADLILKKIKYDNKRGYTQTPQNHIGMVLLEGLGKPKWTNNSLLTPILFKAIKSAFESLQK